MMELTAVFSADDGCRSLNLHLEKIGGTFNAHPPPSCTRHSCAAYENSVDAIRGRHFSAPILWHQIRCAGGVLHWFRRAASLVFPRWVGRVARRVRVRFTGWQTAAIALPSDLAEIPYRRSLFDFRLQMLNKQRSSILPFSLSSNSPSQDIDIHALS
jgi:hypothetical protein